MNGFPEQQHRRQSHSLAFTVVALISAVTIAPAVSEGLPVDCAGDLDRAIVMDSNGEHERARHLLESLKPHCQDFPQVEHNLGVLAGHKGDWESALQHFEQSIAADPRAAMSLDHLRQIHRYRASLAWSKALDASLDPTATAHSPTLNLQDSSLGNSDSTRATNTAPELHTIDTIEYELFDWWQNARSNNRAGWLAHYTRDFQVPDADQIAQFQWDELTLRISLTRHDAVVVLIYPKGSWSSSAASPVSASENNASVPEPIMKGSVMLLRLEGNRWKIYQENPL